MSAILSKAGSQNGQGHDRRCSCMYVTTLKNTQRRNRMNNVFHADVKREIMYGQFMKVPIKRIRVIEINEINEVSNCCKHSNILLNAAIGGNRLFQTCKYFDFILNGRYKPLREVFVFLIENLNEIVPKLRSQWGLGQEPHWESRGPSIKYVTLFLMIFDPPPPVTNCHKSWNPPPPKSMSHFWTKS